MNDIRNLMDNLRTHLDYREFDGAARAPAESWAVLDRISRAAAPAASAPPPVSAGPVPAYAPSLAPVLAAAAAPAVAPEPATIAFFPTAARPEGAAARRSGSLLGRYAAGDALETAEPAVEAARQQPLADVFAKLAGVRR